MSISNSHLTQLYLPASRKNYTLTFTILFLITFSFGCKKRYFEELPTQATLQILNCLDNGQHVYLNLSGTRPISFRSLNPINNKDYSQLRNVIYWGDFQPRLEVFPILDTMLHHQPIISSTLDISRGEIYSLFIHGTVLVPEYSLFNDKIPAINRKDSTTHVRFANFSGTPSISVNIQDQAFGSLVQHIPFKSLSSFIELSAVKLVPGYIFEIRNQENNEILATYTTSGFQALNNIAGQWLGKSYTLVYTGKKGDSSPNNPRIIPMNHR